MKVTINVNGVDTEIELTAEQVDAVKRKSMNIMNRIESFEDACKELGRDPERELPYRKDTTVPRFISRNAHAKLETIIEALNEGWIPDYSNIKETKYFPFLKKNPSGLGLSYDCYYFGYSSSASGVGSRLLLCSHELAEYVGKKFIDIYNEYCNNLKN
jgi:hypothetical protein